MKIETVAGEEEEEGGRTWNNCEATATAKEEENVRKDTSNADAKDDTMEIGDHTISRVQRIKEEGEDLKEDDEKMRGERSQRWFYQAISK